MSDFQTKLMWSPQGVEVTVNSPAEETEKRAEGYSDEYRAPVVPSVDAPVAADPVLVPEPLPEPADVPPADPENEPPTFGAADDATFGESEDGKSKRGGKKK